MMTSINFFRDSTKTSFETRTKSKRWHSDQTLYASSVFERFKDDLDNPLYLALLKEEETIKKAENFNRTTPRETFADNHYDPFYCAAYSRVY